ncbi:hypothetical protein IMG5_145350 [Ichthyophthirius multifiliis]|uniref:Electron transfer flavoprotein subunit beta n=1 Tax=Ichthyophthirius multifiliis TaxID=5932 RepID=G0QXU7_ICHMU|nr:hypothetical protein IMG5_145350 [Ichthyophthirius multifiliis]EGR29944.1 hypothetical protein IMG5_145350 [Ichthyophthirius multifiliis]|eukprot:XP_004031180.1 hypothetical protein IMG5_145350 [Ichthyophthirius multifiliis]
MKALVSIKRVIRVKPDFSGVDTKVAQSINPFCEIAVEEAIRQKEKKTINEIVVLTIGPKTFNQTLKHALAMGADKGLHILTDLTSDQQLQPLIVARILQKIILRDKFDLVFLGKQSIDDDFNQTGQLLAGLLDWPQATFASEVKLLGENAEVSREIDGGIQTLSFKLPGIITCDLRLNTPRFTTVPNIMKANKKPVEEIKLDSLGVDLKTGFEILKTESPQVRQGGLILDSVDSLIDKLKNEVKIL